MKSYEAPFGNGGAVAPSVQVQLCSGGGATAQLRRVRL